MSDSKFQLLKLGDDPAVTCTPDEVLTSLRPGEHLIRSDHHVSTGDMLMVVGHLENLYTGPGFMEVHHGNLSDAFLYETMQRGSQLVVFDVAQVDAQIPYHFRHIAKAVYTVEKKGE